METEVGVLAMPFRKKKNNFCNEILHMKRIFGENCLDAKSGNEINKKNITADDSNDLAREVT